MRNEMVGIYLMKGQAHRHLSELRKLDGLHRLHPYHQSFPTKDGPCHPHLDDALRSRVLRRHWRPSFAAVHEPSETF